jgi:hypothetical protein
VLEKAGERVTDIPGGDDEDSDDEADDPAASKTE